MTTVFFIVAPGSVAGAENAVTVTPAIAGLSGFLILSHRFERPRWQL